MLKKNRDSFSHYYVPNAEIKDYNVLTDGKSFFDLPVKNEKETYEKIIEITRNNDYTTSNWVLLIIAIDLSKQIKLKVSQQIIFISKLETKLKEQQCFFIIEKSEETVFEFSQNSVNILQKWKHKRLQICATVLRMNIQNLQQKNGTSLTVKQTVLFRTTIQ